MAGPTSSQVSSKTEAARDVTEEKEMRQQKQEAAVTEEGATGSGRQAAPGV